MATRSLCTIARQCWFSHMQESKTISIVVKLPVRRQAAFPASSIHRHAACVFSSHYSRWTKRRKVQTIAMQYLKTILVVAKMPHTTACYFSRLVYKLPASSAVGHVLKRQAVSLGLVDELTSIRCKRWPCNTQKLSRLLQSCPVRPYTAFPASSIHRHAALPLQQSVNEPTHVRSKQWSCNTQKPSQMLQSCPV